MCSLSNPKVFCCVHKSLPLVPIRMCLQSYNHVFPVRNFHNMVYAMCHDHPFPLPVRWGTTVCSKWMTADCRHNLSFENCSHLMKPVILSHIFWYRFMYCIKEYVIQNLLILLRSVFGVTCTSYLWRGWLISLIWAVCKVGRVIFDRHELKLYFPDNI